MSYGPDEIYTRWAQRSLEQWKELFEASGELLFHRTGVLWLAGKDETRLRASADCLQRCGIPHRIFDRPELHRRYPQMNFDSISRGLLEPESGVLLARRAVACTVRSGVHRGVTFSIAQVIAPQPRTRLEFVETFSGERIYAANFIFACGPWLARLFPELLGSRIFPTRQEVFFFGTPAGDCRFVPPCLPTWLFQDDEVYGMPDIESRGLKIACDKHGEIIDPDTQSRQVSPQSVQWARAYVAQRFPALKDASVVETRVCQYENTSNGDFLIDRHPDVANVWLAGGGSGHGFKHGPALGEYTAAMVLGERKPEPRFALASKSALRQRTVH
jgi:glycine/D-amino acid oxidase-like deaminating enzyme